VRFLIDAQLPQGLANFLTAAGHDAEHVAGTGMLAASDRVIWDYAKMTGAAVVTKDADFAALTILDHGAQVVWIRFGNTRKAELERRLATALPHIVKALRDGDRLVEVT
jgi:predicted nuclease of predicted toxin-antitoxin system